jgi:Protein of unknown function (DUF3754)
VTELRFRLAPAAPRGRETGPALAAETCFMPDANPARGHYLPLRKSDLIDLLCAEPDLAAEDRDRFARFCGLIVDTFHAQYQRHLEKLKRAYAPFDPDSDAVPLKQLTDEERQQALDDLFNEFTWLMERANFRRLGEEAVEEALHGVTEWGVPMDVDLGVFDRYAIFARGDTMGKRYRRGWWGFGRLEEVEVPVYQRLVMIMKLRPHKRLPPPVDTENVHLKAFKDIPKVDLEMLLPGARIRLRPIDHGFITFPLLTGVFLTFWAVLKPVLWGVLLALGLNALGETLGLDPRQTGIASLTISGLAVVTFTYGYRSYYSYTTTKTKYSLQLTQSLYFQNLDCNGGVLYRLLDEAEEQECREAILAYFFLWHHAGPEGWTLADLDARVEEYLRQRAGVEADFEVDDAVAKLERLDLVERAGDRYRARRLECALRVLGEK